MQSQSIAVGGQCGGQQTQTEEAQSHGSQCLIQQVTHSYAMREGVESQGAAAIETQYKMAQGAPILQNA